MMTGRRALGLAVLALAGLLFQPAAWAVGKKRVSKPVKEENVLKRYLWYTQALSKDFTILDTRYDKKLRVVVWSLQAPRDVKSKGYEAEFVDADLVHQATIRLQLVPARASYRKGTKLHAVLRVPGNLEEVNRVTLRGLR
jgi:hypothetical protein